MTKETYFDMCEQLNSEPIEDEIPLEIDDFPDLVQSCFLIYSKLPDIWDYFNGNYGGKDYSIVFSLFNLHYILDNESQLLSLDFLQTMDRIRGSTIAEKLNNKKPAKK